MAQQPINAGAIPVPTLDAGGVSMEAGFLRTDGRNIRQAGADLRSTWHGLPGSYEAPEAAELFAAMDPVATTTDSFASDVGRVAGVLETFAAEAGPLAASLAQTKMDAAVFAAKVSGDGKWDHHQDLVNQNNGLCACGEYGGGGVSGCGASGGECD